MTGISESEHRHGNCLSSCCCPSVVSIHRYRSFISCRNSHCLDFGDQFVDSYMFHLCFCCIPFVTGINFGQSNMCKHISVLPSGPVNMTAGRIVARSQISRAAMTKIQQFLDCSIFQHFNRFFLEIHIVNTCLGCFQTIQWRGPLCTCIINIMHETESTCHTCMISCHKVIGLCPDLITIGSGSTFHIIFSRL